MDNYLELFNKILKLENKLYEMPLKTEKIDFKTGIELLIRLRDNSNLILSEKDILADIINYLREIVYA